MDDKTTPIIAIFASGNGSNAMNIIDNISKIEGSLQIACVICDRKNAPIIEKIKAVNIPIHVVPVDGTKKEHEDKIYNTLKSHSVNWIFLAGYMRIFSANFLKKFYDENLKVNRIINIHPSLLPDFPGRDGYKDAYDAGVKKHGATIHFVSEEIDCGPIIMQHSYDVHEQESFDSFKERGLALEHKLYIDALKLLFEKELQKCQQFG